MATKYTGEMGSPFDLVSFEGPLGHVIYFHISKC